VLAKRLENNPMRIVVVGSSNTDLVVGVPHIPAPGETILGGNLQTVSGGKGANQAVACARLGANVTFICRLGDDAYGERARAGFLAEGIDTTFVFTTPGTPSGVALIAVSASGENAIVVAPGANAHLSKTDIYAAETAFIGADVVVISLEIPDDAVRAGIEIAHKNGIPVILNPAPARHLPVDLLGKITYITPNETEADFYGGPEVLLANGVTTVILTQGSKGCTVFSQENTNNNTHYAAPSVTAADTVAAGDCFTGALATAIARNATLTDAITFASAAAALKVTRKGAQPGLPTHLEVEAFLAL
jgi:ribokinase